MIRSRNTILADIITANGGTVTNINDRNQLLIDWLEAIGGSIGSYLKADTELTADTEMGGFN